VAKYSADIEIAVRGGQQLNNTIKALNRLNNSINVVTRNAKLLEGRGFNVASVENYSRAVSKAERAVRKAAEGTNQERQAITALVSAMELENRARERKNILIAREIANQRRVVATANAGVGMQGPALPGYMMRGPSSPIGGGLRSRGGRGSGGGGGSRLGGAISGSIIGGAFPLLFGQGAGAATGGAIGGLVGGLAGPGGSFAGSLLGTLLGDIASKGKAVQDLADDMGLAAGQTKQLAAAFQAAGADADKFGAAVQTIRGIGFADEEQVEVIKLVSKLTEDYGGKIDKVATAYGNFAAKGKVGIADINKFTAQGIPILDELEKKYGKNRDQILALAKDGKITAQDLSDALVEIANRSDEVTKRTKSSWEQTWENLKQGASTSVNAIAIVVGSLVGVSTGVTGNILQLFSSLYVNLINGAVNAAAGIADALAATANNIAAFYKANPLVIPALRNAAVGGLEAFKTGAKGTANRLRGLTKTATIGAISGPTIPGQLPPSGGGSSKPKKDTAAEEKQRLDALLKQLQEEIRIRTETIGLEKSLVEARADQNDQLEAQIQSSIRLLDIGSKQAVVQKNFEAGKIGRAEYTLRLQLLELDRTEDQIKYEEDLNRIFKERYGITDAIARLARESRAAAFGGTGATGTFRTDLNLMPGLTNGPLGEEYETVKLQLEELLKVENQVISAADTIGQAFSNSFKGVIDGSLSAQEALAGFFSSVADAFADMVAQMISQWIKMQIIGLAQSLLPGGSTVFPQGVGNFSGAFGPASSVSFNPGAAFGGFMANGGSVSGGQSYIVGERGPELFVPGRSGTIVPNDKMGGGSTNVVVNVDAKGSSVAGDEQGANQLGRVISAAVQSELIKQQRPGGLLAR
jgi:tape measure domain-containing protein